MAGLGLHMRPRPRDMECSISSLTRNQSTGVACSAAVVRGSSPSAPTRRRREGKGTTRERDETPARRSGGAAEPTGTVAGGAGAWPAAGFWRVGETCAGVPPTAPWGYPDSGDGGRTRRVLRRVASRHYSLPMVADPVPDVHDSLPRHHVVIAGTGRAGTSFLVRFLNLCGLDTGTSTDSFDERAKAGLEHNLLDEHAPYVVKDPWLFAYCERVDLGAVNVDALLVPVRELMAAASSRLLQERVAMAEGPWPDWPPSDVHGMVTGGVVYSLDPVDQARILAVGFHRLIHWATVGRIPLILLEFPRIVNDGEYLIETLWPWLSNHCDRETAQGAFAAVADPQLVRLETLQQADTSQEVSLDTSTLDREAMRIVLQEHKALLTNANDQLAQTREVLVEIQARLVETEGSLIETQGRLAETEGSLADRDEVIREYQMQLDAVIRELNALQASLSWRMTWPIRRLRARYSTNEMPR